MPGSALEQLKAEAKKHGSVSMIPPAQAQEIQRRVAEHFVADPAAIYWWDSLKKPGASVAYQNGQEALRLLSMYLSRRASPLYLVVTDDEAPPWPVFQGDPKDFVEMIDEVANVEFFIASEDGTWVVFDTHHNSLVLCDEGLHR